MSHAVEPKFALMALLHDATEAYVGDMVRPLKHQLPEYEKIEWMVWGAIVDRFNLRLPAGLIPRLPREVKEADNRILLDERRALLTPPPVAWEHDDLEPLGVEIVGWAPPYAEEQYLTRLSELLGNHNGHG